VSRVIVTSVVVPSKPPIQFVRGVNSSSQV
jgi:hypothetical protein